MGILTLLVDLCIGGLWLYASWESFKAVRSVEKEDDTAWLCFWCVYSATWVARALLGPFIPFVPLLQLAILVYALFFDGAKVIFQVVVEPVLVPYQEVIDAQIEKLPTHVREMARSGAAQDLLNQASTLAQQLGPQVYETAVRLAVEKSLQQGQQEHRMGQASTKPMPVAGAEASGA